MQPSSPRGPRGGVPSRATAGRGAVLPAAGRAGLPRRPAAVSGAARRRGGHPGAARDAGAGPAPADRDAGVVGGAPGRGLGDRRLASPGHRADGDGPVSQRDGLMALPRPLRARHGIGPGRAGGAAARYALRGRRGGEPGATPRTPQVRAVLEKLARDARRALVITRNRRRQEAHRREPAQAISGFTHTTSRRPKERNSRPDDAGS
jgi:hypothetical protein